MLKKQIKNYKCCDYCGIVPTYGQTGVQTNCVVLFVFLSNIRLWEFFQIWPLSQWISSLVGLVLMYWITTGLYNKRLFNYNLEMSSQFRFWMILSDLLLNLGLGLYYLGYRETLMGQLMLKCPIAVSPVIFILELILLIAIKEYEIAKNIKNK